MPQAIIIGAGPAGLTAAYELLTKTNIKPIIFEKLPQVGGISRTIDFEGNKIDIGGHRFFSKSDKIMFWWQQFLEIEKNLNSKKTDVFFIQERSSCIFFERKFFDYPIKLNFKTIASLGFFRIFKLIFSYIKTKFFFRKKIKNLEDFFVQRFGKELYKIFFKDYTEKVWGRKCNKISADWGAERIKNLSIKKTISHAIKNIFVKNKNIEQKRTETTLINKFLYPKFGPGQLWEKVAEEIKNKGGEIFLNTNVKKIFYEKNKIKKILVENINTRKKFNKSMFEVWPAGAGHTRSFCEKKNKKLHYTEIKNTKKEKIIVGDYFFSTTSMQELIQGINPTLPEKIINAAKNLKYRDFITIGILTKKLNIPNIKDQWIYVQERYVKLGRIQIFNNWSPYLVKDKNKFWIGLEYFCNEGDELWEKSDKDFINFATQELEKINFLKKQDIEKNFLIRQKKAYPAYFDDYKKNLDIINNFLKNFENLFLIGRNGTHQYNNMDHSMLSAMEKIQNLKK